MDGNSPSGPAQETAVRPPPEGLTARQLTKWRKGEALRLRALGFHYERIGDALNINPKTAWSYVNDYLTKQIQEPGEDVRRLALLRLDDLYAKARTHVDNTDPMISLRAIDRCRDLMDRQAKMLGLDVPQKFDLGPWVEQFAREQGVPVGDAVEIAREVVASMGF